MSSTSTDISWDNIQEGLQKLKRKHNKYIVYIIFTYLISLPLIFVLLYVDPCLFNLALPGFALLVPYMIFKEKNFKAIAITGIIVLLLTGVSFTAYQVEGIYMGREPDELSSTHLSMGVIDRVQGEPEDTFTFTVIISEHAYEELIQDDNYTVKVHLSRYIEEDEELTEYYEMHYSEDVENEGKRYSIDIEGVEEALYTHYFSITVEREGEEDYEEETGSGFGPFTVDRYDLYTTIMTQQISTSIIIFVVFLAFLWWRQGMEKKIERREKEKIEESKEES